MSYSLSQFGKELSDLSIQDIEIYFEDERTETDQLEFKSINTTGSLEDKFLSIHKSICAFLNSNGGLIIWGAPVGIKRDGKKEKIFKGNLTYFEKILEKDYVVSKISDSIIPLPNNIRVKILEKENCSLIVIEIDQSEYSPHQTSNVFYMRIDGQSKPAPHHYIEALFKKIKYPNIEAYLKISHAATHKFIEFKITFVLYFFNWSPLQNEEQLSYRIIVSNGIFINTRNMIHSSIYSLEGHELLRENIKEIFHYGEPVYQTDTIVFEPEKLKENNFKARLVVSFGGRFSPRKNSEYILDFKNWDIAHPDKLIVEKKENRLSKDVQIEKGVNKSDIINKVLYPS